MAPRWALRLLGCALLLRSLRGQPAGCAPGWAPTPGGCVAFFPWALSWSRAESFCRRFGSGSHLASVHSAEELRILAELLNASRGSEASGEEDEDEDAWIGMVCLARGRPWHWSDGTAVAFSSWHGTAAPRRRACAALSHAADFLAWSGSPCAAPKPFVCKAAP